MAGHTYTVGQRSHDPRDYGSARDLTRGLEPLPKGGVAVGRTLVEAVGILHEGAVVETQDGQIQVYSKDRRNFLAVYDPTKRAAGDTAGAQSASAPQMAAVIAHLALHPQTPFDTALGVDLVKLRNGTGTPLAAADGAYIAFKACLPTDTKLTWAAWSAPSPVGRVGNGWGMPTIVRSRQVPHRRPRPVHRAPSIRPWAA